MFFSTLLPEYLITDYGFYEGNIGKYRLPPEQILNFFDRLHPGEEVPPNPFWEELRELLPPASEQKSNQAEREINKGDHPFDLEGLEEGIAVAKKMAVGLLPALVTSLVAFVAMLAGFDITSLAGTAPEARVAIYSMLGLAVIFSVGDLFAWLGLRKFKAMRPYTIQMEKAKLSVASVEVNGKRQAVWSYEGSVIESRQKLEQLWKNAGLPARFIQQIEKRHEILKSHMLGMVALVPGLGQLAWMLDVVVRSLVAAGFSLRSLMVRRLILKDESASPPEPAATKANISFKALVAGVVKAIGVGRATKAMTEQNYRDYVQKGRSVVEQWMRDYKEIKPILTTVLVVDNTGSLQVGLANEISAASPQKDAVREFVSARLKTTVSEKFLAQLGVMTEEKKVTAKKEELANLARLGRRLGLEEKAVLSMTTFVAGQLDIKSNNRAIKSAVKKVQPVNDVLQEQSAQLSYNYRDNLPANAADKKPVVLLSLDGLTENGEVAAITAQNAVAFANDIKEGELRAFSIRIPVGEVGESKGTRQNRHQTEIAQGTERLLAAGQDYGLTSEMLARVNFVLVEAQADQLLDKKTLLTQALRSLLPQGFPVTEEILNAYSLSLYTATKKGLDWDSLKDFLIFLERVPLLELLNKEREKDKVYASHA